MASPHERIRNNVRAGIFVTIAVFLAVATIIVLTDAWQKVARPTDTYTVTFEITEGVKNLKKGSEVRVGGVKLGRVEDVTPAIITDEALTHIVVTFSIDSRVKLYTDPTIVVTPPLIGGAAHIDIYAVGTPPLTHEGDITGFSGPGILTTLLGAEGADKATRIVDDASVFVSDLRASGGEIRSLVERIDNEDWPRWAASVDEVMTWATGATDKFDLILDDGRSLVGDARAMINDNRPNIDSTIANVQLASADIRDVAERINASTMDKIENLLDKGQEGVDSAASVLEKLDRDFDVWSPEVRDMLASMRLTGQQLKLGAIEIRRSPWKLLYRPGREELEHELLYEAARSFAMAASDLKAASVSTERLVESHSAELAEDPETLKKVIAFLGESVERFQSAEQRLKDVLLTE